MVDKWLKKKAKTERLDLMYTCFHTVGSIFIQKTQHTFIFFHPPLNVRCRLIPLSLEVSKRCSGASGHHTFRPLTLLLTAASVLFSSQPPNQPANQSASAPYWTPSRTAPPHCHPASHITSTSLTQPSICQT